MLEWISTSRDLSDDQQNFMTESLTQLIIQKVIKPGDVALDIGANHGLHTRHMVSSVGDSGHVHAFEPNPELENALSKILRKNRDYLHQIAAYNVSKRLEFFVPSDDGWGTLKEELLTGKAIQGKFEVPADRAEKYVCDEDEVALIKIDVEGSELETIQGLDSIINKSHPILIVEDFYEFKTVELLSTYGYKFLNLKGEPLDLNNRIFVNFLAVPSGNSGLDMWLNQIDLSAYFEWYFQVFRKF